VHKENLEIHRAIDQAILADSDVYRRNLEATRANMSRVVAELKGMGLYSDIPESSVVKGFVLLFNVLEALVHRHLFFYPICETGEELVVFLVGLLEHLAKGSEFFSV
jgi:hypothetical protein